MKKIISPPWGLKVALLGIAGCLFFSVLGFLAFAYPEMLNEKWRGRTTILYVLCKATQMIGCVFVGRQLAVYRMKNPPPNPEKSGFFHSGRVMIAFLMLYFALLICPEPEYRVSDFLLGANLAGHDIYDSPVISWIIAVNVISRSAVFAYALCAGSYTFFKMKIK